LDFDAGGTLPACCHPAAQHAAQPKIHLTGLSRMAAREAYGGGSILKKTCGAPEVVYSE
jgi:hypothetical protein